ncbi:hypothetical protein ACFWJ4_18805 [Kitasatospora sp. NPDC127067]|uniref:hypothetical protein n=1 Tax=Kitasatospora sp. NPDC127067 TaxID=3347126 RepID=UPI00366726A3
MTLLTSLPPVRGRSPSSLLATGAAGAVALGTWGLLLTDLGPSLRAVGLGPVESWAAPAVLPVFAGFAMRQRLLLVPLGVLLMVLLHQTWHGQQGPVFGWGWWPALGEASCLLFLGSVLPWMVHRFAGILEAEQD